MANHEQHSTSVGAAMERTLFRNLIGLSLVGGMFYFANQSFTNVIDGVVESKYEWVAERFKLSVGHIHKEWMIKGKPKALRLTYFISAEEYSVITVQVNKTGWPLNIAAKDRRLNCLSLWMLFAHEEGHRKSMLDLTSHLEVKKKPLGCEFYYKNKDDKKLIFSYNLNNGTVGSFVLD